MGRVSICPKTGLKKGAWTPEEDRILTSYISRYGHRNWRLLPKYAGLQRDGKSCRLRWLNYLRPNIKRGNFTREEEELIVRMHQKLGNRWSAMAFSLPGRTDNEIKNHWHSHLKKLTQGNMQSQEKKLVEEGDDLKMEEFLPNNKSIDMVPLSPLAPSDFSWSSFEILNIENQIIKDESEISSESILDFDWDFSKEPFLPQNSTSIESSGELLISQLTQASSAFDISNYDETDMSSPTSCLSLENSSSSYDFVSGMTIEEFALFGFNFEENLS